MTSRLALLCLCLFGACATRDPLAPSAEGTLLLAPNTDTTAFDALELDWKPLNGSGSDSHDVLRREEMPFVFPMEFGVGFHFGASDATVYRLSVWFSNGTFDHPTTGPAADAPHGTIDVTVGDCRDGCSAVHDVELEIGL